ncbi:unnamed protein product [Ascophyllum nodosum]
MAVPRAGEAPARIISLGVLSVKSTVPGEAAGVLAATRNSRRSPERSIRPAVTTSSSATGGGTRSPASLHGGERATGVNARALRLRPYRPSMLWQWRLEEGW